MMLRQERVFALVRSLYSDDSGSKRVGIYHCDDTELFNETKEKLSILIRAATSFLKSPNKPGLFQMPLLYTSANMFLRGWPMALISNHGTGRALKLLEFLKSTISHMGTAAIHASHMLFSCMSLCSDDPRDRNGAWKDLSEGDDLQTETCKIHCQRRIIRNGQAFFSDSDLAQLEALVSRKAADLIQGTTLKH